MALHDRIRELREDALRNDTPPVPEHLKGVSKERIAAVLTKIDQNTPDILDAVFALLDDTQPSWFPKAASGTPFCTGASTAHIGCHVGILQRGKGKLDREGRDYWLKPLLNIGALERVYLDPATGTFGAGHPVAKSSNSAYRLAQSFIEVLQAQDSEWERLLDMWIEDDTMRGRLAMQARLAQESAASVNRKHSSLIEAAVRHYAPRFLKGYEVLYIDDGDGDRITDKDRETLASAGISLELGDAMPDVLLWNSDTKSLWVVEAVTSDGEVDAHKFKQLTALAERSGAAQIDFTTVYQTWRDAGARQSRLKNLYVGTYLWISEDPSKHLHIVD